MKGLLEHVAVVRSWSETLLKEKKERMQHPLIMAGFFLLTRESNVWL